MSDDTSGPRSYRARKRRPCDACRRRKICCVKESETAPCSLCQMRSQQCTYISKPSVRRWRQASRASAQNDSDSAVAGSPDTSSPAVSTSRSDTLVPEGPRPSSAGPSLSGQRTASDTSVAEPDEWVHQFVGLSGDQDPYVLRHFQFQNNRYKRREWACIRVVGEGTVDPTHFSIVPDSHLDAWPAWYPDHPEIDVSSTEHRNILDTYFSVVHTAYPLLEPALLKDPPSRTYRPLIGATYQLARNLAPCMSLTSLDKIYRWRVFLHQALPIEARYPRLETVEAGLCFIQRPALIHRAPTTPGLWSEIGSLVGMAHELGLHVDPSSWEIDPAQKRRRTRIAWALFITDKWAALGLGRPSYISKDDWSVPVVTERDFPDPETPPRAAAVFIAMTKLSLILAEVLHQFYTAKAQQKIRLMSADALLELLAGFEDQMDLVETMTLRPLQDMAADDDTMLDPTGTVDLAYHTLRITIHRAALRYLPPSRSAPVRGRARAALLDVVRLLETLQVARLRAFWWSHPSSINFAIAGSFMFSMLLSSDGEAEVGFWMGVVDRYQRLLELQSVGFETAKLAARRLELLGGITDVPGDETAFDHGDVWGLRV